jgi:hypothetical protein
MGICFKPVFWAERRQKIPIRILLFILHLLVFGFEFVLKHSLSQLMHCFVHIVCLNPVFQINSILLMITATE